MKTIEYKFKKLTCHPKYFKYILEFQFDKKQRDDFIRKTYFDIKRKTDTSSLSIPVLDFQHSLGLNHYEVTFKYDPKFQKKLSGNITYKELRAYCDKYFNQWLNVLKIRFIEKK